MPVVIGEVDVRETAPPRTEAGRADAAPAPKDDPVKLLRRDDRRRARRKAD